MENVIQPFGLPDYVIKDRRTHRAVDTQTYVHVNTHQLKHAKPIRITLGAIWDSDSTCKYDISKTLEYVLSRLDYLSLYKIELLSIYFLIIVFSWDKTQSLRNF